MLKDILNSETSSGGRVLARMGVLPLSLLLVAGCDGSAASDFSVGTRARALTSSSYGFNLLATLPQAAPGIPGKFLHNGFLVGGFNESGTGFWGTGFGSGNAAVRPDDGEAYYITRHGGAPQLVARSGGTDPDGNTFELGHLGTVHINNSGDAAMVWPLSPIPAIGDPSLTNRVQFNAAVYRYDAASGQTSTIVRIGSPAPGGGSFAGFSFGVSINGRGDVVFHGITETPAGNYTRPDNGKRYGVGIYLADRQGNISAAVLPGAPAPSGGSFDNFRNSWLNDRGDVAFGGHTTADPACTTALLCPESVYLLPKNGGVISIAHRGDVAPVPPQGSWTYDFAFAPRNNNKGDSVFIGCIKKATDVNCGTQRGVFLYQDGAVQAVAYPGQALQAGGDTYVAVRAANILNNYYLSNGGDVAFTLRYDADANGDGIQDSGVFTWSRGVYGVVAKTGDVIPGVGTMAHATFVSAPDAASAPRGYSLINNRGQILFQAALSNGTGALLVATP